MNNIESFVLEWNGEYWQSVFPSQLSEYSQLHYDILDAAKYMYAIISKLQQDKKELLKVFYQST